jgi:hypothetical protein
MGDGEDLVRRVWSDEWPERILGWCQAQGYGSVSAFLAAHPAAPYYDLSKVPGLEAAPIQLIALQFKEARKLGTVRDAARDCLCRTIVEKFPEGWGRNPDARWRQTLALSTWNSDLIGAGGGMPELEPVADAIMLDIGKTTVPPDGWLPKSGDDPLIREVFDRHWPE